MKLKKEFANTSATTQHTHRTADEQQKKLKN
jgi:hypothetical protein